MFKIESYISPFIMGYIDKYVKLRQEDFQLSLWGGDAVLNNLDLRLDVIEKAVHLPIVFKSGHIHELRIHVPWTKLGSEPVVITINTIECILRLRESHFDSNRKGPDLKRSKSRASLKPRKQDADDLPPGYLQSLMNKIVNNVSIIVNNLIVKFVEDDIVLSLNIKSAEMYSVDQSWERDFIELSAPEFVLRKSINLSDLTVCLDKCDSSGKIEHYQDPLIYRCSVTGRLYTKYDSVSSKRPSVTKFDMFCEQLDVSLTDTQLPMFERLIELCIALYYGTLDPSKKDEGHDSSVTEEESNTTIDIDEDSTEGSEVNQQGWGQWMWSYVPQILPENAEDDLRETTPRKQGPPVLSIGMYGHKINIMFKLTEKLREKVHYGPQKIAFRPFISLEGEGIAVDILMQGLSFFDAQVGITHLKMAAHGQCICGVNDDGVIRNKIMLDGGYDLQEKMEVNYYSNSLFDKTSSANQNLPLDLVLDGETHNQMYTEQFSLQKFGALYFDYLYVMPEVDNKNTDMGSSVSSIPDTMETLFMRENSVIRFIIGPCHINALSSSVHRFQKLLACAYNYNYEPYHKSKPETVDDNRPHPTEEQVQRLEEFIPTKTYHISLLQPIIRVQLCEHPYCDVGKKAYKTSHKSSKPSDADPVEILPCFHLTTARFDYQYTSTMYPRKLVQFVSKMAAPSSNLLHHCHAHSQIKLFDFSAGLVAVNESDVRSHVVTVIPPCSGALYTRKLMLSMYWKNTHISKVEKMYELPQISININKANLMLILELVTSWVQQDVKPTNNTSLIEDVFSTDDEKSMLPVLELNLNGFEMKHCITSLVSAYTGTLSSVQVILYDVIQGSIIPVFSCPGNTSKLTSTEYFRNPSTLTEDKNDFLTFTLQLPHEKIISDVPSLLLLNTEGVICAIDPSFSDWFDYIPKKKVIPKEHHKEPVKVDIALAQAASPLQYRSQASSGGSIAIDTTSCSKTKTHSRNKSASQRLANQKTDNKEGLNEKLAAMFPFIKMLQVHVEVKSCAIFIHQSPLRLVEPSLDISQNLQMALTTNTLPPTAVVCLPQIHIVSSGMKATSCLQEIPVNTSDGALVGEKLPWRMVLTNFCVHTILSKQMVVPMIKPVTVSCTIGVTTKYSPPTSDNISSLGLCLHTDMHAVIISVSRPEVQLCTSLCNQLISLTSTVTSLVTSLKKTKKPPPTSTDLSEIALPEPAPPGQTRDYTETETSDVTSREPTPSLDLGNDKSADKVKLSLWLQWTLPKLELRFYVEDSSKVALTLDDMTLSLDVEQVYTKAKVKCGSCNAHIYQREHKSKQWTEGPYLGILMTCQREIPHDTHMISNKTWSHDQQTVPNFSPRDSSTRDVTHSFLNLTFTRALCKNVAKKMRKLNEDLADLGDHSESYDLYFHKYIGEICLNVEPCDFIFQPSAINAVIHCFNVSPSKSKTRPEFVLKGKAPKNTMPMISASSLPLIYINLANIRLFIQKTGNCGKQKRESTNHFMSQDLLVASFHSLSIVPQADNPLPRHPEDRELYHRALHANLTQQPGSAIENRQYQVDIKDMSLCTGLWDDFLERVGKLSSPSVQIPALEWNTIDKALRKDKEDIELLPLVMGVDVKVVAAPAIVYQLPGETGPESKILVCGHALEINFTNDLDLYISTNQVKVISDISLETVAKLTENMESEVVTETFDSTDLSASGSENIVADSGIESDASTIFGRKDRKIEILPTNIEIPPSKIDQNPKISTPLDILLTASRISIVTYSHKESNASDVNRKRNLPEKPDLSGSVDFAFPVPESMSVMPFLYLYISQPHTVLSCHPQQQKFEMSCYDVQVKGSSLKSLTSDPAVIPESTDYNVYWLETRPGRPHPNTGIPPSLFTLKIEDFLLGSACLHLRLDRPMKINTSLDKLDQINAFLSEIIPAAKNPQHSTPDEPPAQESLLETRANLPSTQERSSDKTKKDSSSQLQVVLSKVSKLDIYTDQLIVAMETSDKAHGILGSLDWLSLETNFNQNEEGKSFDMDINIHLKNTVLKTIYEKKSRTCLQPCTVTIETNIENVNNTDQDVGGPRSVITMTTGLVSVVIGQENIQCIDKVVEDFSNRFSGAAKLSSDKEKPKTLTAVPPGKPFIQDSTTDDIRQGQFTYIIDQDDDNSKCNPGEIIFCNKDKDGNSHMTWCYHQPRAVTLVSFKPIPFNIPVKQITKDHEDEQLVPGCLQYYEAATHNFINYIEFELSENEDTSLMFPEFKEDNSREITLSNIWRIVIYQLEDSALLSPSEKEPLAILPMSLAAATRVDSCYIPSLLSVIQGCVSCPVIEIRFQSHPQHLGKGVPGKLQPYRFDDTPISDEEFAIVTVKNFMVTGHQLTGALARMCTQISGNLALSVIEMKHLTIQPCVSLTDVFCDVNYLQHMKPPALETNINIGPMYVRLGQGVVHTLNSAVQSFSQLSKPKEDRVLTSQYIICNDTYHTVRFGQVGTEENILLQSRNMHCYSWRSHKMKKEIHMCLDGKIWKWCEAFNLDTVGTLVRVVKTIDRQYTVIIQIKKLSNAQLQIIIKGQFSLVNRLSCDLEVDIHTLSLEHGNFMNVLQGETTSPTYVMDVEQEVIINVRKTGSLAWSKDVLISRNQSSHMVYVPVKQGKYVHIWCHVYEQISRGASRLMVMLCPLYVLRSHLPCSLFISMGIPNLGAQRDLEMAGKGRELQLELLGDAKYNLSFKLRPDTDKVDPALTLSTELINQVERGNVKKVDFDEMMTASNKNWVESWPYTGFTLDGSQSPGKQDNEMADLDLSLPTIDLSLTLTEYWPGCSTLLIDVCPWCLLTNHSTLDLVLMDSNKTTWPLPQRKTFSPPKLQKLFSIGIVVNGNLHCGGDIALSDEEVADQRYRQDLGKTLYLDGFATTRIPVRSQTSLQIYFLTLQSKMVKGIRIITVRETYCISNQSDLQLALSHHSVQLSQHKFSLNMKDNNIKHLKKKSSDSIPLPSWTGYMLDDTIDSDVNFVNYLLIGQDSSNQETDKSDKNEAPVDWSTPVRLVANESPGRVTVAVPIQSKSVMSLPLCIVGQTKNGVSYFVIKEDKSPSCLLYNYTTVPIVYGFQNLSLSRAGYTTQEEAELTTILPTIHPNQHVFYTPSTTNRQFLLSIGDSGLPKIHIGIKNSDEEEESKKDKNSKVSWSDPIDINQEIERFIQIPGFLNLKVKVIRVAMVTHVVINAASRAEISAKEVRSKIGTVTVTENTSTSDGINLENSETADDKNLEIKEFDVCVPRQEVFTNSNVLKKSFEVYASLHFHHLCLILQDESCDLISEIVRLSCDHLFLAHYPLIEGFEVNSPYHDCYSISLENIQIDNQLFETKGLYDFPVILSRQEQKAKDDDFLVEFHSMNLSEKLAVIKNRSFGHMLIVMETDCLTNSLVRSMEVAMEPVIVNIDDRFIYRMLEEIEKLIPTTLTYSNDNLKPITRIPSPLTSMSHGLSSPIRIKHLVIQPCSLLVSVHASLKVFIASDKTPLSFGKFEKRNVNSTSHQLVRVLAMHYASGALFRAGIVVGSLEILGNPTGLVRSIGTGVADLVRLPYGGLTRGPGAFVSGVSSGMTSFVRNISSGMLTSMTNFASSVSRNMERLSMDDLHQQRQEERRRQHPDGLGSGLKNGLSGFGMSLLGAIAGIADQPLQTMMSRQGQRSAATELVSGVGKGLVGVITKPLGGAAEFFSQTGQGLLYGTGLSGNMIKPLYPAEETKVSDMCNGNLKYVRKLLQSLPNCELQSSILCTYLDVIETEVKVELLLTNELLLMVGIDDDNQQQAFSLTELEVKINVENPQLMTLVWKDSFHQENQQPDKSNKDRVAAFIDGTSEFVRPDISLKFNLNPTDDIPDIPQVSPPVSSDESRPGSPSLSPSCRPSFAPEYNFLVDPYVRDVFIAMFLSTKFKLLGKGFV